MDHRTRPLPKEASSRKDKNKDSASLDDDKGNDIKARKSAKAPAAPAEKGQRDTGSGSSNYSSGEDEAFHGYLPSPSSRLPYTKLHGPDSEPTMVTNANRDEYTRDYIVHLTHFAGTFF